MKKALGGFPAVILMWSAEIVAILLMIFLAFSSETIFNQALELGDVTKKMLVGFGAPSGALTTAGVSAASIIMFLGLAAIAVVGASGLVTTSVAIGAAFRLGVIRSAAVAVLAYLSHSDRDGTDVRLENIRDGIIEWLRSVSAPQKLESIVRLTDLEKDIFIWMTMFIITLVVIIGLFILGKVWQHNTWTARASAMLTVAAFGAVFGVILLS